MTRASVASNPGLFIIVLASLSISAHPLALGAQQPAVHDSLRLGDLQDQAIRHDPRTRQLDLLASQSALRMQDIDASRLPAIGAAAQAQYQSDVLTLPVRLPNGQLVPAPPHDTYDAHIGIEQPIYDPAVGARRNVERAELAESRASVQTITFALRSNVNAAYFSALLQQARRAEMESAITDLEAKRELAASRVANGTALQSEADMLEAEILKQQQAADQIAAIRDASLVILRDLTGASIPTTDALALPNLAGQVASARADIDSVRARPEYIQFDRSRDVLQRQKALLDAASIPSVSAFGRTGYGRPGLDPLAQDFRGYWLAGVQVKWAPWNWGTTMRKREVFELQRKIVATNEAAFEQAVRRQVAGNVTAIDQLAKALADDDAIVALRERILHETGLRFSEGVIMSPEYVARETDLLDARLARVTHQIQLAQARADLLTSLGLGVQR
jgi:outer membrane protein TolC